MLVQWYWLIIVAAVFGIGGFLLCSLFVAKGKDDRP